MLPIILFPTMYKLAVCSLGTLNPSEQFSICSTITVTGARGMKLPTGTRGMELPTGARG